MSLCLGIIGTAGRGNDARLLTPSHYRMMCIIAQTVAEVVGADHLVSGGSAFADHVAVQLFLDGAVKQLTLHLPCRWIVEDRVFDTLSRPGERLNELHLSFAEVTGIDPLDQLGKAIKRGATVHVHPGGFKARNSDVAAQADVLLAFTFSGGALPSDGGTRDTWDKFAAKAIAHVTQEPEEDMVGHLYYPEPMCAYHFDLTNRRLHRHVYEDPAVVEQRAESAAEDEAQEIRRAEEWLANHNRTPRTPQEETLDLL